MLLDAHPADPETDHLLANPTSLERLREELLTANVSLPRPQWAEVSGLPFLDACIQEGLRCEWIGDKITLKEGFVAKKNPDFNRIPVVFKTLRSF